MKKLLCAFIIFTMLMSSVGMTFADEGKIKSIVFSDVPSSHWALSYINILSSMEIIKGYPDGTFKPQNNVKVNEFITMAIKSLGYSFESKSSDWAKPYIDKAIELNLIQDREFADYNALITREQMLSITVNALKRTVPIPTSTLDAYVKTDIKDYHLIENDYKQSIIDAYKYGLSKGYPDGTFRPRGFSTRAEACVVLSLLNAPEKRQPYVKKDAKSAIIPTQERDAYGQWYDTTYVLYAPIFNGKPVNEIIEMAELMQGNQDFGKGYARFMGNQLEQGFGFAGFRERTYFDEIFEGRSLTEQSFLYAERMDISFAVKYIDLASEWQPYDCVIWKKNQSTQNEDYPTYFLNTYGYQMKRIFDFLFEGESEKAWEIFKWAINHNGTFEEKTQYLNNRHFYVNASSSGVSMRISLKR